MDKALTETPMKERPILFSGEMVQAIMEGRKSQTRRVIKATWSRCLDLDIDTDLLQALAACPFGQVGDRLWVRETWRTEELEDGLDGVRYRADDGFQGIENTVSASDAWFESHFAGLGKWRPSIFMPRWASRISLEITGIRVERVQEISEDDAKAEGAHHLEEGYRYAYCMLWNEINAKRGFPWTSNPWVWVIEFRRVQ